MRQLNDYSTPVPRYSAIKQWIERTDKNDEEANGTLRHWNVHVYNSPELKTIQHFNS